MHHDNSTADRGDVDGSGDPIASAKPHLPKLVLEMLDVRLADPLQAHGFDTFSQAQEGRRMSLGSAAIPASVTGPRVSTVYVMGRPKPREVTR